MKTNRLSLIDTFLGLPFLAWLHSLPLPRLYELCRRLMAAKLLNWAMVRTITNLFGTTQEFRELLSRDQQMDFMAVESSIRKKATEEEIWIQAVAYVLARNVMRLLDSAGGTDVKLPELAYLLEFRRQQLERYAGSQIFKLTLQELYKDKKLAYSCYTAVGSQDLALALHGLDDEMILRILSGAVSKNFIKDILQLKNGDFLVITRQKSLVARDRLLEEHAKLRVSKNLALVELVPRILALPNGVRHACLFTGNMIDLGYLLKKDPDGPGLLKTIEASIHPLYLRLISGAMEDRLKINRLEPDALSKLAVQYYRMRQFVASTGKTDHPKPARPG